MPACLFAFNGDYQFTWANAAARSHVGYELAELLHLHPWDLKPDYPQARFLRLLQPLHRGETDALDIETHHRHRAGHLIPVAITMHILPASGDGYLAHVVPRNENQALAQRAVIREANRPRSVQLLRPALHAMAGDMLRDMDLLQDGRPREVLRHLAHYAGWLLGV